MKVAIKPLTDSDLALFEAHAGRARQRAIELSGDVFVDKFYPGLGEILEQVIVSLVLIGPGGSRSHQLTRTAQRARGSKNWRLSGEPIYDPIEEPGSYDALTVGDFGVFAFEGAARPAIVTLVLVSAREDARLHDAIATRCVFMEPSSMIAVPDSIVAELRAATNGAYDGAHPLDVLGFRDTVEDVLFGGTVPVSLSSPMLVSQENLLRQLSFAEETRQRGEELFGWWLTAMGHGEDGFDWISQVDVRSVFDYEVYSARWVDGGPRIFVCVKTTRGLSGLPIHMSIGELNFAASAENCRIARVSELEDGQARLRILSGVQVVAKNILSALGHLPVGASADSIQLDPAMFEAELEAVLT